VDGMMSTRCPCAWNSGAACAGRGADERRVTSLCNTRGPCTGGRAAYPIRYGGANTANRAFSICCMFLFYRVHVLDR
jgi:hypothetical protein